MGKPKTKNVVPRLPKGMRDLSAKEILLRREVIEKIRKVYEIHGFAPLETPTIEYVDCLGKYLPESDEPSAGIFSFRYDDDQWVATRYDLTAPLARYFAQYNQELPKPFRRYQVGTVFRNEKVKKGRFREFMQFDFDSVGTASMLADVEVCQTLCEAIEKVGFVVGQYKLLVNNRKILNGLLELTGITSEKQQLTVLRAVDKLDRLGLSEVVKLFQKGREDESGDFTKGAELTDGQVAGLLDFLKVPDGRHSTLDRFYDAIAGNEIGEQGVDELTQIHENLTELGIDESRVVFSSRIVRGLEYYTGPVFELELTGQASDENGDPVTLGAVAAGGRYDSLVKYFTGQQTPATGASIGVDRLVAAMAFLDIGDWKPIASPVLITVMDKAHVLQYQQMARRFRDRGIAAEIYIGTGKFAKQMSYADKRGCAVAIIAGQDEFEAGQVTIKDLIVGRELAADISERGQWLADQPSQVTVRAEELVDKVLEILTIHDLVPKIL